MRAGIVALVALMTWTGAADAQTQRGSKPRPPARPPAAKQEAAHVKCPAQLGEGVTTKREFCDVLIDRNPANGIIITIPPHTGPATVSFDLHNRHTYSEQEVREGRGFAEYMATVGLLTMENELISRAAVRSSFRRAPDLFDRVSGGAAPGGVKAVAPVGSEPVRIEVPQNVNEVSLLGERLGVDRIDGHETFTASGRPIAVVSNIQVEYRPAPVKRPTTRRGAR
jgi:hypothetical protein